MFDHSECVTKRHCLMLCLTRSHLNIFPCVVLNPRVILMQATFTYIRNYINCMGEWWSHTYKHFACLRNRESRMIKSKIKNPIPLLYFFSMAQWPITRKTFHRLRHDTKSDRFCKIMITWHSSWQTSNTMQLRIVTKNNYDCNEIYNPIQCNNTE